MSSSVCIDTGHRAPADILPIHTDREQSRRAVQLGVGDGPHGGAAGDPKPFVGKMAEVTLSDIPKIWLLGCRLS